MSDPQLFGAFQRARCLYHQVGRFSVDKFPELVDLRLLVQKLRRVPYFWDTLYKPIVVVLYWADNVFLLLWYEISFFYSSIILYSIMCSVSIYSPNIVSTSFYVALNNRLSLQRSSLSPTFLHVQSPVNVFHSSTPPLPDSSPYLSANIGLHSSGGLPSHFNLTTLFIAPCRYKLPDLGPPTSHSP